MPGFLVAPNGAGKCPLGPLRKCEGRRSADGGKLYVKDGPVMDSWTTRANWTHVASGVKDYAIWQKGDYNSRDYVNVIQ